MPQIAFKNSKPEINIIYDDSALVEILRNGSPQPNDDSELHEIAIYSGSENPILYLRSYELELRCTFKLEFYPFDAQQCKIEVRFDLFF